MTINSNVISNKDAEILSHLRKNAREKVTVISKRIKVPVTTVYDRIRSNEKKGIVNKHVTLLNFPKLGYNSNVVVALKVAREKKNQLEEFLTNHPNVNSLYKTDFGHDFLAELVFEDMSRFREFIETTEARFELSDTKIFNLIQEVKKEGFMKY